jgi:hypothetical protein
MRAEVEAAEARGLTTTSPERKPKPEPAERRLKPEAKARMRVVWAVCDIGGRTVATFDYPNKADAEALAAQLKAKGKGNHFIRSVKESM